MHTCKPELCGMFSKKGKACPYFVNGSCYTEEEITGDLFLCNTTEK